MVNYLDDGVDYCWGPKTRKTDHGLLAHQLVSERLSFGAIYHLTYTYAITASGLGIEQMPDAIGKSALDGVC